MSRELLYGLRALLALAIALALWWSWSTFRDFLTAPVKTELNVSRANNAGFKASADAQAAGVKGLEKAARDRKEKSAAAVKSAGTKELAEAGRIHNAPATGATDYERAQNRINKELGLQ